MAPGPRTRVLSPDRIAWLDNFRRQHGYSMPRLNRALGSPFKWRTLQKAIDGKPILEVSHGYIVQWLERYAPPFAPGARVLGGKDRAAGETDDPDDGGENAEETARTTGTVRREANEK